MQLTVERLPQVTIPIQKAAEMLGLSHWTLRRMVAQGKVAAVKLNKRVMIEAEEIQQLVDRSRISPHDSNARPGGAHDPERDSGRRSSCGAQSQKRASTKGR